MNHPREMAFPRECFFDSIGHLGQEGKRLRSEALLRGLMASDVPQIAQPAGRADAATR